MTGFLVALVVTALGVALLVPMLRRAHLIDTPNARSSHEHPVPRGGGLAILGGVCIATASVAPSLDGRLWMLLAVALILGGVGLLDDVRSLAGAPRLAAQLCGAGCMALVLLSGPVGLRWPTAIVFLVATLAFAAYVNAFNFMDGVNGISGASAVVAGCWFWWLGGQEDQEALATMGAIVAGAAAGFLPWNAPRARVFMGDVGSYGLGALIAGLAVTSWVAGNGVLESCAPLVIYLADTGMTLVGRLRRGEPVTQAHRGHVYQRLVDLGLGHGGSAAVAAGLALVVCVAVVTLHRSLIAQSVAVLAMVSTYLALPRLGRLRRTVGAS